MSTDSSRISQFCMWWITIFSAPVELAVGIFSLYQLLGWSRILCPMGEENHGFACQRDSPGRVHLSISQSFPSISFLSSPDKNLLRLSLSPLLWPLKNFSSPSTSSLKSSSNQSGPLSLSRRGDCPRGNTLAGGQAQLQGRYHHLECDRIEGGWA